MDTGKTCSKCETWKPFAAFNRHSQQRDGYRPDCRECENARRRARYAENPAPTLERNRGFAAANPEYMRQRNQAYRATHDPQIRATRRRRYYSRTAELCAKSRAWRETHPDQTVALRHNRRAELLGLPGRFTAEQWRMLCDFYGRCCLWCGRQEPDIQLTPDHIVPMRQGGANDLSNLQPLCWRCNTRKKSKHTDYRQVIAPFATGPQQMATEGVGEGGDVPTAGI